MNSIKMVRQPNSGLFINPTVTAAANFRAPPELGPVAQDPARMKIGDAVKALQAGKTLTRDGWNGVMNVAICMKLRVIDGQERNIAVYVNPDGFGDAYLPMQADLFADDWFVVNT